MDHIATGDRDIRVDIESGLKVGLEDSNKGVKTQAQVFLSKAIVDRVTKGDEGVNLADSTPNSDGVSTDQGKFREEKTVDHKKVVKEKRKKTSNKKPPRPPRGPSLDAADEKLIKEIAEIAMLKRARIERMKALKKMKTAKSSSSSNSNVFAMVFTVLFCLVILFQGMSSGGSSQNFQGSPESAETTDGGLISVQYLGNAAASELNGPASESPNGIEPVTGSDPLANVRRAMMKRRRL